MDDRIFPNENAPTRAEDYHGSAHFERMLPDAQGIYRSEVFPGLWLDAPALLRGDLAAVLACLQEGTRSPEHAAFVARLNAAGGNA